jgi:NAD(P)H dehydrogenase (quinone)
MARILADADRGIAAGELLVETTDLEKLIGRPATTVAEVLSA